MDNNHINPNCITMHELIIIVTHFSVFNLYFSNFNFHVFLLIVTLCITTFLKFIQFNFILKFNLCTCLSA